MAEGRRDVSPIVKVLVVAHMALVLHWSLPRPAPAVANGMLPPTAANIARHPVQFLLLGNEHARHHSPTRFYLLSTGLWQYWDMFAPNPAHLDYWYDSVVTYQDGSVRTVPYPRMKTSSLWRKFLDERYRKYIERTNNDETDSWKWPAFAQRMALMATTDERNLPVRVVLRRHYRFLAGPGKPEPKEYQTSEFFVWIVDEQRLRADLR
jgi:hypothetical protein